MKTITTKTFLPIFSGYYGNCYWETDSSEDNELYDINQHREDKGWKEVSWDDLKFNYEEQQINLSKAITEAVETLMVEFIEEIIFEKLVSPKFYNFSNDSINVEITIREEVVTKYLQTRYSEFKDYLKRKYTSRSGFISSYPNNVADFMEGEPLNDKHKLGSILNFIAENESIGEVDIYEEIQNNTSEVLNIFAENYRELIENEEID